MYQKTYFVLTKLAFLLVMLAGAVTASWAESVTFTFNTDAGIKELGISKPATSSGSELSTSPYTLNGVSMTATSGSTATRIWNSNGSLDLRIYKSGGSLTFTAPGNIISIVLSGTTVNKFNANVGSFSSGTWTGNAASVTLSATDTGKINTITVTYETTKLDNAITVIGGTAFTIDRTKDEEDLTLSASATSGGTVDFAIDSEHTTVAAADYAFSNGYLLVSGTKSGVITITATVAETDTYKAAQATITVTVVGVKENPTILVSDANVAFGSTFTIDATTIESGTITVSSGNEAVATVSGLTITPVAVGTTAITVTTAEDNNYKAGSETFLLTVTAPTGQTTAAPGTTTLFKETFDGCDGTGGRDDTFTGNVGTSDTTNKLDENWEEIGQKGAWQCIKLGTSKNVNSVTTSNISLTGSGTLTFNAAGWGDEATNTVSVSATGATLSGDTNVTLTNGEWGSYTVNIAGATGTVAITFTMKRGFLDDVVVESAGESITATLNSAGFATFCSQYPLDFTGISDYSAWQITGINTENIITFEQITGSVKGGTGLFLKGEAGAAITLNSADSDTELTGNLLEGTLAPTYVESGTYYGLSGTNFAKVNAGTVMAGKAILKADWISESSDARFTFIFAEPSGITEVGHGTLNGKDTVYSLSGQRVNTPKKGMYIVNGKKIMAK